MSSAELNTSKVLVLSLQRQKMHSLIITETVFNFWLNRLSVVVDVYLDFCKKYSDYMLMYGRCKAMTQNDLMAIQTAANVAGVNREQLLLNWSCSLEEELLTGIDINKMYYIELPPIALEVKKIRWFIIYKVMNSLRDRKIGWERFEKAMKGHNKVTLLRVRRGDRF